MTLTHAMKAILGETAAIRRVRDLVLAVAPYRDVPVLVTGETGTGKELVARAIHDGDSADRPFVAINAAALPDALFESELFGHEAGSYTGARGTREGLLESAGEGTVFFDEIGEMSAPLQSKLLRVLETRTFRRVGSNRDLPFRARVVSATNRPLAGPGSTLRPDLLFRLAGFTLPLPALRDRATDISLLATAFLDRFCARYGDRQRRLSSEAIDALLQHPWPGNIRELKTTIEAVAILSRGDVITEHEMRSALGRFPVPESGVVRTASPVRTPLPSVVSVANAPVAPIAAVAAGAMVGGTPGGLRGIERELIVRTFAETGRNLARAARVLDIPRTTLRDKLKRYGVV